MYDVKFSQGDIVLEDTDFQPADQYQAAQNVLRNVVLTRRGSMPTNPEFGSGLLHEKAVSELAAQPVENLADRIAEDILHSVWLVNPILARKIKCDYVVDEENKTVTWRFFIQSEDTYVPLLLKVGKVETQLGVTLVFD